MLAVRSDQHHHSTECGNINSDGNGEKIVYMGVHINVLELTIRCKHLGKSSRINAT